MIVCLCKGVSSREVERAIRDGARTVEAVGRACGAGTGSGCCQDALRRMIAEEAVRPRPRPVDGLPLPVLQLAETG